MMIGQRGVRAMTSWSSWACKEFEKKELGPTPNIELSNEGDHHTTPNKHFPLYWITSNKRAPISTSLFLITFASFFGYSHLSCEATYPLIYKDWYVLVVSQVHQTDITSRIGAPARGREELTLAWDIAWESLVFGPNICISS